MYPKYVNSEFFLHTMHDNSEEYEHELSSALRLSGELIELSPRDKSRLFDNYASSEIRSVYLVGPIFDAQFLSVRATAGVSFHDERISSGTSRTS